MILSLIIHDSSPIWKKKTFRKTLMWYIRQAMVKYHFPNTPFSCHLGEHLHKASRIFLVLPTGVGHLHNGLFVCLRLSANKTLLKVENKLHYKVGKL